MSLTHEQRVQTAQYLQIIVLPYGAQTTRGYYGASPTTHQSWKAVASRENGSFGGAIGYASQETAVDVMIDVLVDYDARQPFFKQCQMEQEAAERRRDAAIRAMLTRRGAVHAPALEATP